MVICLLEFDGFVMVVVGGGIFGYEYEWSNGQIVLVVQGLDEGMYMVIVFDVNDCVIVDMVYVDGILELGLDFIMVQIFCNGVVDGLIIIILSGGDGNYMYSWSNGLFVQFD